MNLTGLFYNQMLTMMRNGDIPVTLCRNAFVTEAYAVDRRALNLILQLNCAKNEPEFRDLFTAEYFPKFVKDGGLEGPITGDVLIQEKDLLSGASGEAGFYSREVFEVLYSEPTKNNPNLFLPVDTILMCAKVPKGMVRDPKGVLLENIPAYEESGGKRVVFAGDNMFFAYRKGETIDEQLDRYQSLDYKNPYWGIDSSNKFQACDENGIFKNWILRAAFEQKGMGE